MSLDDNPYSLERLADRAEIYDVLMRWSRGVDRLDFNAIRSVFHPDAIDEHGAFSGGVDELVEWIKNRHAKIPFSMHLLANVLIEFGDKDSAVVETYVIAPQRYPADARKNLEVLVGPLHQSDARATDLLVMARYVDHFTRRNGEWKIQLRHVVFDSSIIIESASEDAYNLPVLELGARSFDDRIYKMRREVLGGVA